MVTATKEKVADMVDGLSQQLANSSTKTGAIWRQIVTIANKEGISFAEAAAKAGEIAGDKLPGNFSEGVKYNIPLMTEATGEAANKAVDKMKESAKESNDVGTQMMTGAESGITKAKINLIQKAAAAIKEAIERMKKAAEVHSPSKKTAEIGKFMSLGLAKGIDDYANEAVSAAESATEAALGAFNGGDGFGINSASATPYNAASGLLGGNSVTQYNTFNQVDTNLDMNEISKRLGWQVATAL